MRRVATKGGRKSVSRLRIIVRTAGMQTKGDFTAGIVNQGQRTLMTDGSRNRALAQRAIAEAWGKCSELNGFTDGDAKVTLLVIISPATVFKFGN